MSRHRPESVSATSAEREGALHDLANLLDASLRCAGVARRVSDPARQWGAIEAALEQMADLVPLLGWGRGMPGRSARSVEDAVRQAGELMRPVAAEHGIELDVGIGPGLDAVRVPGLLRVLTDGLRNSVEAILARRTATGTRNGSSIALRAHARGEACVIEIEDDGIGPPAHLSKASAERGWGLVVAEHIVRRARGTLHLGPARADTPTGAGAVLRIVLPMGETNASSEGST